MILLGDKQNTESAIHLQIEIVEMDAMNLFDSIATKYSESGIIIGRATDEECEKISQQLEGKSYFAARLIDAVTMQGKQHQSPLFARENRGVALMEFWKSLGKVVEKRYRP